MHKLFCIIGRTGVGKSTITKMVADDLKMTILRSYTTRKMRDGETKENSDHIFIAPEDVERYRDDMVAYTERAGYCSFATKKQLINSDLYIINPSGLYELECKLKDADVELIPIYITLPYYQNVTNAIKRGDLPTWRKNYEKENQEFADFEDSKTIFYRVLNNTTIEDAAEKIKNIIKWEGMK